MGLHHYHLDPRTRQLMLKEIERDEQAGSLYLSSNLSFHGRAEYPELLKAAARDGTDSKLAAASEDQAGALPGVQLLTE